MLKSSVSDWQQELWASINASKLHIRLNKCFSQICFFSGRASPCYFWSSLFRRRIKKRKKKNMKVKMQSDILLICKYIYKSWVFKFVILLPGVIFNHQSSKTTGCLSQSSLDTYTVSHTHTLTHSYIIQKQSHTSMHRIPLYSHTSSCLYVTSSHPQARPDSDNSEWSVPLSHRIRCLGKSNVWMENVL